MANARRKPGVHTLSEERVLLVTKNKITGAERCDWWPSVEEAEDSNMIVLEVRDRIKVEKEKKDWKGLNSMLNLILGKSGTQDNYLREDTFKQREFFESVDDKKKKS